MGLGPAEGQTHRDEGGESHHGTDRVVPVRAMVRDL